MNARFSFWLAAASVAAVAAACGGGGGGGGGGSGGEETLACDSSIAARFKPDSLTSVLLVKAFKKGDALVLAGTSAPNTPVAANDLCFVKLNVGPGNAGPAGAPSTSPGIGIEVWLPNKERWNRRLHLKGGGGWAGGTQGTLTGITPAGINLSGVVAQAAGIEGAVAATTDTGHAVEDAFFAMNPDGGINEALWRDFAERAIHEMAVKTKALARAYYGEPHKHAYFNGFSTGGRQAMKQAQAHPADFDGILAGAPGINWSSFMTGALYPQIVYRRDLAGAALTPAQQASVGAAATAACSTFGGVNLGYVLDPLSCRYDPTTDASVLCVASGGTNSTSACVNQAQARTFNKIWYGQTADGSAPAPAADNGAGPALAAGQRWYGLTRGTYLGDWSGDTPSTAAAAMVALELQDATIATPAFLNAKANGADNWRNLTYQQLAAAADQGKALQGRFGNIDTDSADLSALRNRGAKLLAYHGLADTLVPPQGTIHYYQRVASGMGGIPALQDFYRLYLVPGMGHGFGKGTAGPAAVPVPSNEQLYKLLTDWVEQGLAPPARVDLSSTASADFPSVVTRPMCLYPLKPAYTGGNPLAAAGYACQ